MAHVAPAGAVTAAIPASNVLTTVHGAYVPLRLLTPELVGSNHVLRSSPGLLDQ